MSTLSEECFSRKILIGGCPLGITVGTQARWLVRMAVSNAGRNLENGTKECSERMFPPDLIWVKPNFLLLHVALWPHFSLSEQTTLSEQKHTHDYTRFSRFTSHFVLAASAYFPSCLMTQSCNNNNNNESPVHHVPEQKRWSSLTSVTGLSDEITHD